MHAVETTPSRDELAIAAIAHFLAFCPGAPHAFLERPAGTRPGFLGARNANHGDGDFAVAGAGLPAVERDHRVTQQQPLARSDDPSRRFGKQARQLGLNRLQKIVENLDVAWLARYCRR